MWLMDDGATYHMTQIVKNWKQKERYMLVIK